MPQNRYVRAGLLFLTGAAVYPLIEIAVRGRTHWSMAAAGGACLVLIERANRRLHARPIFLRALAGAAIITSVELIVGLIVNRALRWAVWDYSAKPLNLFGQICPQLSLCWFLLCLPVCLTLSRLDRRADAQAEQA